MRKIKLYFILFLFCGLGFLEAYSQEFSYKRFDNIRLGVNSSAANCFVQDEDGMIWIGTNSGLFYYDGYSMKRPVAENNRSNIQIYCAAVTGKIIYLGTEAGLSIYDTHTDSYVNTGVKFPSDIRALLLAGNTLWIGSIKGLYKYDITHKKLFDLSKGLPHKTVYSLLRTSTAEMYVGTYDGLVKYNENTGKYSTVKIPHDTQRSNLFVNSLIEDTKRGLIWIGTEGAIFCYDNRNSKVQSIDIFKNNSIKSLALNVDNNLIVGTDNGLYVYDSDGFKRYIHDSRISTTISNNIIWSVFVDRSNNLWVGTDHEISLLASATHVHSIPISELTGIGDGNVFYSIFKDSRGYLWLGGANGLIRYDGVANNSIWYSMSNQAYPITHNRIRDIYEDSSNNLWIATDGSINRYDYDKRQFIHYGITDDAGKVNANWAYNIFEDSNKLLWVGTFLGGVFMIDRNKLVASKISQFKAYKNITIPNSNVATQLIAAYKSGAWAIFKGAGLYKISHDGTKALKVNINQYPIYIVNDDKGRLWCAYKGGIYIIHPDGKVVDEIDTKKYIKGNIYAMRQIKDKMWIVATDGVWSVDINNKYIQRLLLPNRPYSTLFYDENADDIYIGGADEILKVSSTISKVDNNSHKIVVTGVYVNDIPLKMVGTSVRYLDNFTFSYDENHVVVEFSDLNYVRDNRRRFLYRMSGVDKDWVTLPDNSNRISFANLSPGEYILSIKPFNAEGTRADNVKNIKITIRAPWYYSGVAKVIYFVLFTTLIIWIVNFFRVKSKLRLERIDRDRSMVQVKYRMEFFTNISHEFKTPLSMIIGPVGKMLPEAKDPVLKRNLNIIRDNAMKLNSLIHSALDFNRIDMDGENLLIFSHLELVEFSRSIMEIYKESFPSKNFIFNPTEDNLYLNLDVVKIESVLNNILSNACKYSGDDATIVLSLRIVGESIEIKVSDDGVGIPSEEIPFIFQRLYQSTRTAGNREGTGIGLYLAKTYIEMHNGNISVEANEGGGTVFTFSIPITEDIEPHAESTQQIDTSRNTVLIVDDNVAIANFIKDVLSSEYNCLVANNGRAGLAVCGSCVPSLMIVDVMMPVMDGMEMCRRIKRNTILSSIPIILLTAKDDLVTESESIRLGIDTFMSKPFDAEMLLSRVKQLLKSKAVLRSQVRMEEITTSVAMIEAESVDEKLLSDIIKVIEDNIDSQELNVNFVCEKVGLSTKQLYRKIKQHIGITPVEYIKQIRLKKAAMLIQQKKFTISEVMYMVGFSSSSYFSKCFQQQFGKTPRQYLDHFTD